MSIVVPVKLAGHRDNLEHVYASFIYNQLFIKNISQLRDEKCHRLSIVCILSTYIDATSAVIWEKLAYPFNAQAE